MSVDAIARTMLIWALSNRENPETAALDACYTYTDGRLGITPAFRQHLDTDQQTPFVSGTATVWKPGTPLPNPHRPDLDPRYAVTSLKYTFSGFGSMPELILDGWNTEEVNTMQSMCEGCGALTALSLAGLDTSGVVTMQAMCRHCGALASLSLAGCRLGSLTDISALVQCDADSGYVPPEQAVSALVSVDLTGCLFKPGLKADSAFGNCRQLPLTGIAGLVPFLDSLGSAASLFTGALAITGDVDASSWFRSGNLRTASGLLSECRNMTGLNVSGWNLEKCTDLSALVQWCQALSSITGMNTWRTPVLADCARLLLKCGALEAADLSALDMTHLQNLDQLCWGCASLSQVVLPAGPLPGIRSMEYGFSGCGKLDNLDLTGLTGLDTLTGDEFSGTTSLHTGWAADPAMCARLNFSGNTGIVNDNVFRVKMDPGTTSLVSHVNGEEPQEYRNIKKIYISPSGDGARTGNDWINAAPFSSFVSLMQSRFSGYMTDPAAYCIVYMQEGEYGQGPVTGFYSGMRIYGGFPRGPAAQWGQRDAFLHPTVFRGNGTKGIFDSPNAIQGSYRRTVLDGLTLHNMKGFFTRVTRTDTMIEESVHMANCSAYDCSTANPALFINPENCYAERCSVSYSWNGSFVAGVFAALDTSGFTCGIRNCTAVSCSCTVSGPSAGGIFASVANRAARTAGPAGSTWASDSRIEGCTAAGCTASVTATTAGIIANHSYNTMVQMNRGLNNTGTVSDCSVIGCTCTAAGAVSAGLIADTCHQTQTGGGTTAYVDACTVLNCDCAASATDSDQSSGLLACSSKNPAYQSTSRVRLANCLASGCTLTTPGGSMKGLLAAIGRGDPGAGGVNSGKIVYCTVSRCAAPSSVQVFRAYASGTNRHLVTNSVSWNNTAGAEFDPAYASRLTGCAGSGPYPGQSYYQQLGTGNDTAQFTSLGIGEALAPGAQKVGAYLLNTRETLAEYVSWFGDWRPGAGSVLKGNAMQDPEIDQDITGTGRSTSPTTGAYE